MDQGHNLEQDIDVTETGGLDRGGSRVRVTTGSGLSETEVAEFLDMISNLLQVVDLDLNSNFIEEGGHSLLAVDLDFHVEQKFNSRLDLKVLYGGTLRDVVEALHPLRRVRS